MGYREDAIIGLARAKRGDDDTSERLQAAQIQATLALLEVVEGMSSQLDHLIGLMEDREGS